MRDLRLIQTAGRDFLRDFSVDGTECFGFFLCKLDDEHYAAVNNSGGQRKREDFHTKKTAILWLNGHLVLNIDNVLCDGMTGKQIPDAAERVRKEIERERK